VSTLSAALGASAAPVAIEHNGTLYKFKPLIQVIKTEFERWLTSRAIEADIMVLKALKDAGLLDNAEIGAFRERFATDYVSGKWAFGGPEMAKVLQDKTASMGTAKLTLMAMLIGTDVTTLLEIMQAKPDELMMKFSQVLGESMPEAALAKKSPPESVAKPVPA